MKMKFFILLIAACLLGACAPQQTVRQGSDYSHPQEGKTYYEFTSYGLEMPSVLTQEPDVTQPEILPGEDEDFTSENITSSYGTYGDVVITVATHKFKLGANAGRKEMALFQQAMDRAYQVALQQYRPMGFTYAMSSVGAVNPLSDMEVTCKMSEGSANAVGQNACNVFFSSLASNYRQLVK